MRSRVANCSAAFGGGLAARKGARLHLTNSVLSRNEADDAAALSSEDGADLAEITNVQVWHACRNSSDDAQVVVFGGVAASLPIRGLLLFVEGGCELVVARRANESGLGAKLQSCSDSVGRYGLQRSITPICGIDAQCVDSQLIRVCLLYTSPSPRDS